VLPIPRLKGRHIAKAGLRRVFALLLKWGPAVAWMGVIFYISSLPDTSIPISGDEPLSIGAHLAEYAILGFLLLRAVTAPSGWLSHRWLGALITLLCSFLYALSDEWHQSFVPGRFSSPVDVMVDVIGAGLAILIALSLERLGHHY